MYRNECQILLAKTALYNGVIGDPLPAVDEKVILEADHAVAGEIHYTDGQYVQIGRSGIDYTGSHIANHVWKERPKRFLYLPPLMAAYRSTGVEAYAEAARDYIADFIRAHPTQPGWSMARYDNGLNLGVRIPFWAEALAVFAPSPAWDDLFCEGVLASITCQLEFIRGNLSPRGNFRMKQAMTLIETGLRLPFLPESARWRRFGVAVMNDAARRQILPDGAHIECTAGYHLWMTRLFRDCLKLAGAYPELGFSMTVESVAEMFDYALASTRPNGTFCGIHDIEGDWEGSHPNPVTPLRSEFRRVHGLADGNPPLHQVYPVAGQAFLRDSWEESATYLTFEATRWGGAHCHLSRNSLQLHAFGRTLLMDPGRISYEMSNPLGPYAKSTRAHNTLNLNGWNQNTTNPDDFRSFGAPGYDCLSATYTGGYWQAPFGWWFSEGLSHGLAARHTRHLFWVHGRWAVVIDEITRWKEPGRGPDHESPALELNWQLSPGAVTIDQEKRRVTTTHPDANLLICFAQAPEEARIELHEGAENPPRGWVRDSTCFAGRPAPQLSLVCRPWQGYVTTLVTLLVPFAGASAPAVETVSHPGESMSGCPCRLALTWADGTTESLTWMAGLETMVGECDEAETDGVLFYRRQPPGGEKTVAASVDATYVTGIEGASLLAPDPRPGEGRSR